MSTPAPVKKKTSIIEFIAIFLALYFLVDFGLKMVFPETFGSKTQEPAAITLSMEDDSMKEGDSPIAIIKNTTAADFALPKRCPQPPFDVMLVTTENGSEQKTDLMANTTIGECVHPDAVKAGETAKIPLTPWKYALFAENGTYQLELAKPENFTGSGALNLTTRFTLSEPGVFTKVFRTFVSKPLFNGLLLIGSVTSNNLGIAIIILTIIVKLVLLVPNQHALEGQRKLQMLQPKLDELKKKHPDDPRKVQEETMRLWKEFNINPLQSCLPTLLQFPILIGLFYVVQDGAAIDTSRHLLYSYFVENPVHLEEMFLGLNLLKPSWIFPPLLFVLQLLQVQMMAAKAKKKEEVIDITPTRKWRLKLPELNQQTAMLYMLPFVVAFFAIRFPAAVSLYWAVSTLFGIAQQAYVNREKIKLKK